MRYFNSMSSILTQKAVIKKLGQAAEKQHCCRPGENERYAARRQAVKLRLAENKRYSPCDRSEEEKPQRQTRRCVQRRADKPCEQEHPRRRAYGKFQQERNALLWFRKNTAH